MVLAAVILFIKLSSPKKSSRTLAKKPKKEEKATDKKDTENKKEKEEKSKSPVTAKSINEEELEAIKQKAAAKASGTKSKDSEDHDKPKAKGKKGTKSNESEDEGKPKAKGKKGTKSNESEDDGKPKAKGKKGMKSNESEDEGKPKAKGKKEKAKKAKSSQDSPPKAGAKPSKGGWRKAPSKGVQDALQKLQIADGVAENLLPKAERRGSDTKMPVDRTRPTASTTPLTASRGPSEHHKRDKFTTQATVQESHTDVAKRVLSNPIVTPVTDEFPTEENEKQKTKMMTVEDPKTAGSKMMPAPAREQQVMDYHKRKNKKGKDRNVSDPIVTPCTDEFPTDEEKLKEEKEKEKQKQQEKEKAAKAKTPQTPKGKK
ncbi:hypothetical protein Q1695_003979 [Nippostrongylus brasiliensis]|nr:hypothetical protein Q1695_003979 [Nippostrongylus brasiliensis]